MAPEHKIRFWNERDIQDAKLDGNASTLHSGKTGAAMVGLLEPSEVGFASKGEGRRTCKQAGPTEQSQLNQGESMMNSLGTHRSTADAECQPESSCFAATTNRKCSFPTCWKETRLGHRRVASVPLFGRLWSVLCFRLLKHSGKFE